MIFHVILGVTLATIFFQLVWTRSQGFSTKRIVSVCLQNILFVQWGVGGIFVALPHIFSPDSIANFIGWPAGSPFQLELGFASLGIAILGILSLWIRGNFWIAPVVAQSTFLLGAAGVHIQDLLEDGNFAAGNAGPILFYDIFVPLVASALLVLHLRYQKSPSE
ncbi:hypothetical protein N9B31_08905 [Mariniblastus sp.]|nr:hypothetical protein [Mariniblastus sp.]MDA7903767.1 hypothetical protein [Mariniblastus sp.]MDA7905326.1 hypothetical protein [Mariniblastus sp.]MDA7924397.1 hypothetical protein [Mariniblastus sp.]